MFFSSFSFFLLKGGLGSGLAPEECARERVLLDRIPSRKIEQQVEFYNTYINILTCPTPHHL